jgi:hypothetical protein
VLIRDSRTHLLSMLAKAGVVMGEVTSGDVRVLVDVVRRFATIPVDDGAPVEDDGDGMLAQFGSFNFRGTPEFSADLTRQLIEAGDEDAPIWQLQCTFYCDRTPATDALADATLWSFGVSIDEFFTQAITLPGWAFAFDGSHAPRELAVTLEEV